MANHAVVDDHGYICITFDGDQDGASIQDMVAATKSFIDELVAQKRPICLLVDLRHMTHISLHGRQAAGDALKVWPYHKIAVYGANLFMRGISSLILSATNKNDTVQLFENEAQARKWLGE